MVFFDDIRRSLSHSVNRRLDIRPGSQRHDTRVHDVQVWGLIYIKRSFTTPPFSHGAMIQVPQGWWLEIAGVPI